MYCGLRRLAPPVDGRRAAAGCSSACDAGFRRKRKLYDRRSTRSATIAPPRHVRDRPRNAIARHRNVHCVVLLHDLRFFATSLMIGVCHQVHGRRPHLGWRPARLATRTARCARPSSTPTAYRRLHDGATDTVRSTGHSPYSLCSARPNRVRIARVTLSLARAAISSRGKRGKRGKHDGPRAASPR